MIGAWLLWFTSNTGWPRKNAPMINNKFFLNEGQNEKVVCIIVYRILFEQDDTKIVTFDEGVLILWPFFWGNVIFKIFFHFYMVSFSRFALLSQKSLTYRIFSIVWLPRVNCQLLLCKAKPAWIIKRSIHYITLQHYIPGELLKEIPPYLKGDICLRKMALDSLNLGVIACRKKNVLLINALTNLILVSMFALKLLIVSVAIL